VWVVERRYDKIGKISSRPLKVRNHLDFLACKWRATYRYKALNEGYNFASNLISIGGFHAKLWAPKVVGVPVVKILGLPLGVLGQNDIWVLVLWPSTEYTIKGKVVTSPKFGWWWVLWVRVCPGLVLTPKMFQLCINQLVVWFCAGPCEWVIACHSS
jgi:hypothetical protein